MGAGLSVVLLGRNVGGLAAPARARGTGDVRKSECQPCWLMHSPVLRGEIQDVPTRIQTRNLGEEYRGMLIVSLVPVWVEPP